MDQEEYVEAVLSIVERVPPGRVTTYGAVAAAVGRGGPRQVGRVMASYGGPVPWWRVIRADGTLPACHAGEAMELHRSEGTPLLRSGRVDMRSAFWDPAMNDPGRDRRHSGRSGPPGGSRQQERTE